MSQILEDLRPVGLTAAIALAALLAALPLSASVAVGDAAPSFSLPDLRGEMHSLEDYRGKVVVLEWINPNCPFSARHAGSGTMTGLAKHHPDVVWLGVNSTAKGHQDHLTPREHLAYNAKHGIEYPVLVDESGAVGHDYAAKTTPHMIVIDEEGTVIYDGAIDDDPYGRADAPDNYVADALAAHAAGRAPDPATTKPYGCSVKYGG